MNKINKDLWQSTEEAGLSAPFPVGPQVCRILEIEDDEDKQYLIIRFDVISGDLKGTFAEQESRFNKWPSIATLYRSYKPTAYPFLKSFVTALEKSNTGYSFEKAGYDFESFINKAFVAVFAEEEIPFLDDNNKVKTAVKVREVRSIEALKEGKIKTPSLKKLSDEERAKLLDNATKVQQPAPVKKPVGVDISDDDLPF